MNCSILRSRSLLLRASVMKSGVTPAIRKPTTSSAERLVNPRRLDCLQLGRIGPVNLQRNQVIEIKAGESLLLPTFGKCGGHTVNACSDCLIGI